VLDQCREMKRSWCAVGDWWVSRDILGNACGPVAWNACEEETADDEFDAQGGRRTGCARWGLWRGCLAEVGWGLCDLWSVFECVTLMTRWVREQMIERTGVVGTFAERP